MVLHQHLLSPLEIGTVSEERPKHIVFYRDSNETEEILFRGEKESRSEVCRPVLLAYLFPRQFLLLGAQGTFTGVGKYYKVKSGRKNVRADLFDSLIMGMVRK